MPTAAKMISAVLFMAVAFLAAEAYKPGLPPETQWGVFSLVCAGIGLACGWLVMGPRVGKGYYAALGIGVRTSATIAFWALLFYSIREMILRSIRKRYGDVFEAIEGTFDIMLMYGLALLRPEPLIVLAVGGLLGGLAAEWSSRRWR